MWFLFREVSSSSGCLGWATLFYCGTPWAFHIIIFSCISNGFNHFHIHPLYHRHYLQSPRQSNYHNLLVLTWVHYFENHWHSGPLHILLHLHTISSITTSGSDILSNNSCPSSFIHPCPSWLLLSFLVQNIFSIPFFFLIIGPHSMKHKGTLN